ncbi:hypothetical protein ABKA04_005902 [Annulohypoxylon sp. FPYF3050]
MISAPPAIKAVSDTASARLTHVTSSSQSYYTARTEQSQVNQKDHLKLSLSKAQAQAAQTLQSQNQARIHNDEENNIKTEAAPETTATQSTAKDIPQNQRWIAALLNSRTDVSMKPEFSTKDIEYGRALKDNKNHDKKIYTDVSAKLVIQADGGVSLARRMFLELRNIHRADIPFISAAPLGDALDKIVASIEGPPGTPYEGGTFWIAVKITESKPPMLKFHTRIYHPNIDPRGKVCADYASWWRDASLLNGLNGLANQRALPWFSEHVTNHYSLGSLLVAFCGLLASPNIDDPLVPEIAEKYLTDYEAYCGAARLYTQRFAHARKPEYEEIIFPEEDQNIDWTSHITEYQQKPITPSLEPQQTTEEPTLTDDGRWYRVALPKPLTSTQREEIENSRSREDEKAEEWLWKGFTNPQRESK